MGQFGCHETTVLSDPGNCPLTNCHPGVGLVQDLCGDGKLHSLSLFFKCSAGAHPAEVSQAFIMGVQDFSHLFKAFEVDG
jgi:hypothetical protein